MSFFQRTSLPPKRLMAGVFIPCVIPLLLRILLAEMLRDMQNTNNKVIGNKAAHARGADIMLRIASRINSTKFKEEVRIAFINRMGLR